MTAEPRQVVVLAGGLATRLGKRAETVPKYLQPVADRPFAAWQLEQIAASGFNTAVLCIGHLGDAIRESLGDGSPWGISIRYLEDGPSPLGTGGALRRALPLLEPTFVVTYGDSFLPFDYQSPLRDLESHPETLGTMAVYRNRGRFDRSNTRIDQERVVVYDKSPQTTDQPELDCIDYGAIALRRTAVEQIPTGPSELSSLQAQLAAQGQLRALLVDLRFFEIGSEQGLAELDTHLRDSQGDPDISEATP